MLIVLVVLGHATGSLAQDPATAERAAGWADSVLAAGDLRLAVARTDQGIHLVSLSDVRTSTQFLPARPAPLFTLVLHDPATGTQRTLDSVTGWTGCEVLPLDTPSRLRLRWLDPVDPQLKDIRVTAAVTADAAKHALRWELQVDNDSTQWSVWRVDYPQLVVTDLGPQAEVFLPRGPGEVQPALWQRAFQFRDTYPGAWMTMQFMAAYDRPRKTGIYVALHDAAGATKDLAVESRPEDHTVSFLFQQPVENMGVEGNDCRSPEAVWRLLRGDWFDAAVYYRDWVRACATWHPSRDTDARRDTRAALQQLDAWAVGGGDPWVPGAHPSAERVTEIEQFAAALGVPTGMHWYGWHPRPFDNDYPHYLPAKPGFREAVAQLQAGDVSVMPYINGRLWDTRDHGLEDFEFTRVARPFAAKNEQGEVITEEYGSKEEDGSPVRFAVMCPATQFWQERVYDITLRLYTEYGVKGVYIDQIAAATARLCFDPTHGHPLGGGHWWADGYRQMLERIRRDMPRDCFLTTECNAEAYVRWFDGYLTWHWQYDGQVPAFPAVYGGALTLFGRSYGGGETRDLALSMKAGQQLVFGEQLGWINPSVITEPANLDLLSQLARLRHACKHYFDGGQMARPPRPVDPPSTVRADWGWGGGNWWVTTDSLLTGAWQLPDEQRLLLLFVNVGPDPVSAHVPIDCSEYGLDTPQVHVVAIGVAGAPAPRTESPQFDMPLALPARTALAYEVTCTR
jgi:hypothetical protein